MREHSSAQIRKKGDISMDMMNSIAAQSVSMSAAEFSQQYAISVTKKAMDSQEQAAQALLEMLPPTPPMGQYIDVYA